MASLKDTLAMASTQFYSTHREELARRRELENDRIQRHAVAYPAPTAEDLLAAKDQAEASVAKLVTWITEHPDSITFANMNGFSTRLLGIVIPQTPEYVPVSDLARKAWNKLLNDNDCYLVHFSSRLEWHGHS